MSDRIFCPLFWIEEGPVYFVGGKLGSSCWEDDTRVGDR